MFPNRPGELGLAHPERSDEAEELLEREERIHREGWTRRGGREREDANFEFPGFESWCDRFYSA